MFQVHVAITGKKPPVTPAVFRHLSSSLAGIVGMMFPMLPFPAYDVTVIQQADGQTDNKSGRVHCQHPFTDYFTPSKARRIPPEMAVPKTPARLGPMACIIRKLKRFSRKATI